MPDHPTGFYPFVSDKPLKVTGLYMARPLKFRNTVGNPEGDKRTLLVLVGSIRYGKGQILLNPGYPVDANQPFNDLLFYNILTKGGK